MYLDVTLQMVPVYIVNVLDKSEGQSHRVASKYQNRRLDREWLDRSRHHGINVCEGS